MKIIINKCYGGFSLSADAIDLYLEKKGEKCFRYTNRTLGEKLIRTNKKNDSWNVHCFIKDLGDGPVEWPKDNDGYFYNRDISRDDKILVEVVEELGSEKSSGECAKLEIVEIPDGTNYEIEEYDGIEWIAETHRTWR